MKPWAKKSFVSQLPNDGSPISNKRLREALKWEEDDYLEVKQQLLDDGVIGVGRGYGGTVARAEPVIKHVAPSKVRIKEGNLYMPLKRGLRKWAKNEDYPDDCIVEIIGAGGKKGGGVYSKPDLVLFAQRKYRYTPLKRIDVLTFEVKTADGYGLPSVYETAAHSRFANKSYLVIQKPPAGFADAKIKKECIRFQVGLIIMDSPEDPDTWEFLYDPDRRDPDPDEVEEFIETQVSDSMKKKIALWVV